MFHPTSANTDDVIKTPPKYFNGTSFVKRKVTKLRADETIKNIVCCPKNMLYYECSFCDIKIKKVVNNYIDFIATYPHHWHGGDSYGELVKKYGDWASSPFLINDMNIDTLLSDAGINVMSAIIANPEPQHIRVKCAFCKEYYDNTEWYHRGARDRYHPAGVNAAGVGLASMFDLVKYANKSFKQHYLKCDEIKSARRLCIEDAIHREKQELCDKLDESVKREESKFIGPMMDIPDDLSYLLRAKMCDCGDNQIVECKICNTKLSRKYEFVDKRYYYGIYDHVAKSHFKSFKKNKYGDYRDAAFKSGRSYHCVICGDEYENVDKELILNHFAGCLESNREKILATGNRCIF